MLRPLRKAHVRLAASLIICMFALRAHGHTRDGDIGASVDAIWLVQSFDFYHNSSSVTHSCGALRDRIVAILESVGAQASPTVEIRCGGRTAQAQITLASPVDATPENIRAATTSNGRAELIARMRNFPLPTSADIEHFPATWRRVSLRGRGKPRLDVSDCELWRRMITQIFPKLSIRVQGRPLCIVGAVPQMPREIVALMRASTVATPSVANQ